MSFYKEYVDKKQFLATLWLNLAWYELKGEQYEAYN